MSMIRVSDQLYPYPFSQLRADNPRVSFPLNPGDAIISSYDAANVADVAKPTVDPGEVAVEGGPELFGGSWRQTWVVVNIQPLAEVDGGTLQKRLRAFGNLNAVRARIAAENGDSEISFDRDQFVARADVESTLSSPPLSMTTAEIDGIFMP
jgi:hypothetical protein